MTRISPYPPCARCGRVQRRHVRWPEGWICGTCHTTALETHGRCAQCGTERLTPGIAADGGRLCASCAGIPGDYTCRRCGTEARRHRDGCCERCILTELLHDLLDDGTGAVRPELLPLFEALRQMRRPRSGSAWANAPHVQQLLRSLAHAEGPLTHETLDQLQPRRAVTHLRDLLMHHGILPLADRHLLLFEAWLTGWLPSISNTEHRRTLEHFARWRVLRQLRTAAANGAVGDHRCKQARLHLTRAAAFLAWLTSHDLDLSQCTQADLDAWHAENYLDRRHAHPFLRWCMETRRIRRLHMPTRSTGNPAPLSQHQRITLIRRLLTSTEMASTDRAAGLLILLYAQPVTRIVRLRIEDITCHDGEGFIRLGDPPAPIPEPFATVLLDHTRNRPNTSTAANPGSPWLFPGQQAGQPAGPEAILKRLRRAGIPALHARTSTMRQLVLQAPPPVVANMLGYHASTATHHAEQAGQPWHRYAPGDHNR
jgi:hypothetical protein